MDQPLLIVMTVFTAIAAVALVMQAAMMYGVSKSTRAVARACATNRVALLVPCHRVVGADGSLTGYRWGVERKRQILEAESR